MKRFRKLSLLLAMSLVLTQTPLTGAAFTWAEPAEESVSSETLKPGNEAGDEVSNNEEEAKETVSGQKEEKATEEEPATGTVSTQDEEATSGNSVSSDTVETETEEAAGEDANMVNATTWGGVQEAFNNKKNVTLSEDITSGGDPLVVSGNTTVTLDLNGHKINRDAELKPGESGSGNAIRIDGGNLTLTDSSQKKTGTITGGNITGNGGGVFVRNGTFTMSGGNITGNKATYGGGVSVMYGTFTMKGGSIDGNTAQNDGGGVCVIDDSTFTMTGGEICKNEAGQEGGGVYLNGTNVPVSFNMSDGDICENKAGTEGGGVVVFNSTFTMNGGKISKNRVLGNDKTKGKGYGGGIYAFGNGGKATLSMNYGEIDNNTATGDGGGVYVITEYNGNASFDLKDGRIINNTASYNGGGIYSKTSGASCNTLTNMHNGIIEGNTAKDGGGVYLYNCGFTMEDGKIVNNKAMGDSGKGGGVAVNGTLGGARFTMNGGEIAQNNAARGGGAWVYAETNAATKGISEFILNDGYIKGNTAITSGGGVYVKSDRKSENKKDSTAEAVFTMNDGDITGNNAGEYGGGIRSKAGEGVWTKIYLLGGSISDNSAQYGGGLSDTRNRAQIGNKVSISNNHATDFGGGIYNYNGQLTVSGGCIENNEAGKDGGGIYTYLGNGGRLSISGNLAIIGNYKTSAETVYSNVVLVDHPETTDDEFKINITGKLENAAKIGIKPISGTTGRTKACVITKDLIGNGTSENFIAEGNGTISLNAAGELEYIIPCAHDGGYYFVGAKEPTCVEKGSTGEKHCSLCGALVEEAKDIDIDPDNHDYDEGTVTKEPKKYENGEMLYRCRRKGCTHTKTEKIPAKGDEGEDEGEKKERDSDTSDLSGNSLISENTVVDEKTGVTTETISVNGRKVVETKTDAEGNETQESFIWIGGLLSSYTYTGAALKPSFRVYDGMKVLKEKTDYTVAYSGNKDKGSAKITVNFKGNYKGTPALTSGFTIEPAKLGTDVFAHDMGVAKKNRAQKPVPVLTWASTGKTINKKNFEVTYDREVKDNGDYTATITPKNSNFTGSVTARIKVTDKNHLLENAKVSFKPSSYAYTGSKIEPLQNMTVKLGQTTLTPGKEIKVTFFDNTLPGTATAIIEAISTNAAGYAGSKTASFKIKGIRQLKDGEPFTMTVDEKTVPFTKGGAKTGVTVKDGDTLLKNGRDYTLIYKKNKAVTSGETAEVIIKGKGNYRGSVTRTFAIKKQDINAISANITAEDVFKTKSNVKKASVTIIDTDGKKLALNKDYTLGAPDTDSDKTNTDVSGNAYVTITGKGAYEGEVKVAFCYKEAGSNLSKVKAMKAEDHLYTGSPVRLSTKELEKLLYTGSKTSPEYLKYGVDFVVKGYENNTKKGTAKVTLKGRGLFAGKKTVSFKIKEKKGSSLGALVDGKWVE